MTKNAPIATLFGRYDLTDEAFERERAINPQTKKRQTVVVRVDGREVIRTKYAVNEYVKPGNILPDWSYADCDDFILCKLEPNLDRIGVIRGPNVPVLDHILSTKEATEMVEREMSRYDEVLEISRAAYKKRTNTNTVMVTLTGTYTLTEEAHRELFLAGTPMSRDQTINVTVSAREALRTGYLHLHRDGKTTPSRSLFSKLVKMRSGGTGLETPEFDHLLTEEEATKIVTDEMARYDDIMAESAKIIAEKEKKHREEIDDLMTNLDYYMPLIKDGKPCVIDPKSLTPQWFEMEDERVDVRYDLIEEESGGERAVETGRFLLEEREKREREPVLAWIKENGSPQLQRASGANITFEDLYDLYTEERLALELPDWKRLRVTSMEKSSHPLMRTPTYDEVDALVEASQTWPSGDVRLCLVTEQDSDKSGTPMLVMRSPWEKEKILVGHPLKTDSKETPQR